MTKRKPLLLHGLHLPPRMEVKLTTRVFYRFNGDLFGVYTVPDTMTAVQMPDFAAVPTSHVCGSGGNSTPVPVLKFQRVNIGLQASGDSNLQGRIVCFVEQTPKEEGSIIS